MIHHTIFTFQEFADALGIIANFTSNIAFVPQIIKSFKTKSVEDISIGMFTILFFTQICWIVYSIPQGATQLWLSSTIEIFLLIPIFVMWWVYNKKDKKKAKIQDAKIEIVSDN